MNTERLLKLADFLEALPPEKFDLNHWAEGPELNLSCNTTGCALGWATAIPEFGLTLIQRGDLNAWVDVTLVDAPNTPTQAAGCLVFDLTPEEFERIFTGSDDYSRDDEFWRENEIDQNGCVSWGATPKEVAANIRRMVEENQ